MNFRHAVAVRWFEKTETHKNYLVGYLFYYLCSSGWYFSFVGKAL